MLRKDREIQIPQEKIDILRRCDTLRVGIRGEEYPYVVPVSFGLLTENDAVTVYFHCARKGYKIELLEKDAQVCVEADLFEKVEPTDHGITTRYESVIGFGTAEIAVGEEKVKGLQAITEHYGFMDYPIEKCRGLEMTTVYKVTLVQLTGKRNKTNG